MATRVVRVAGPLVAVGLATTGLLAYALPNDAQFAVPATSTTAPSPETALPSREQPVSRDAIRTETTPSAAPTAKASAEPKKSSTSSNTPSTPAPSKTATTPPTPALDVTATLYATDDLNIRVDPEAESDVVTVVDPGTALKVTRTVRDGFRYVSYDGKGRWVTEAYLSKTKPDPVSAGGTTTTPCKLGSSMESGLTPDAILVHRTVCALFPKVTSYGGVRSGDGFHASGRAVDCMIADSDAGWVVAKWVRAHAKELGVSEVIHAQRIWTVQRSSEGWRAMSDRGSATANHYDHVHVSVYGNRATA